MRPLKVGRCWVGAALEGTSPCAHTLPLCRSPAMDFLLNVAQIRALCGAKSAGRCSWLSVSPGSVSWSQVPARKPNSAHAPGGGGRPPCGCSRRSSSWTVTGESLRSVCREAPSCLGAGRRRLHTQERLAVSVLHWLRPGSTAWRTTISPGTCGRVSAWRAFLLLVVFLDLMAKCVELNQKGPSRPQCGSAARCLGPPRTHLPAAAHALWPSVASGSAAGGCAAGRPVRSSTSPCAWRPSLAVSGTCPHTYAALVEGGVASVCYWAPGLPYVSRILVLRQILVFRVFSPALERGCSFS